MRHLFKSFCTAVLCAVSLLLPLSCEKYEQAPENDRFEVTADIGTINADGSLPVTLVLSQGTIEGACLLSVSLTEHNSGYEPSYTVLLNGESRVTNRTEWSFDKNGRARFTINGLESGHYDAVFAVTRWYHTATTKISFTIH